MVEIVHAILADEISMYIMGENPAMSIRRRITVGVPCEIRASRRSRYFLTETAAFADNLQPQLGRKKTALSLIPTGVFKLAEKRCKPRVMPGKTGG